MAATPEGRQRQTAAESRQAIIGATSELLRNQPFRELSVESVMEKANLSRTIFYRHFDSLSAVVIELVTNLAEDVLTLSSDFAENGLASKSGLDAPNSDLVRDSLAQVVGFFAEHGPLLKGVADAAVENAELEVAYEGFLLHFSAEAGNAIRGLVEAGIVDVPDPQAMAEALNAMNERYLLRALGRHPQEDLEVVLNTVHAIWARTLFSESLKA
ncbi:MAG: TetR/AcrR family transcriptional regulator [Solirubrobacterales bacterium]|nr:TetR/AcrR family transcriptional regulator [Solirubrobacterales bacterium]